MTENQKTKIEILAKKASYYTEVTVKYNFLVAEMKKLETRLEYGEFELGYSGLSKAISKLEKEEIKMKSFLQNTEIDLRNALNGK